MAAQEEAEEAEAEEQDDAGELAPLRDADWLEEQYVEEGRSQEDIAEELGTSSSTVSYWMGKHEIESRANVIDDERLEDADWLEEQYVDEEKTMQEIADEVGCSDGTVMRRLHKFDIPVRRSPTSTEGDDEDDGGEEAGEGDDDGGEDDEE